jgi:hypothetical protein
MQGLQLPQLMWSSEKMLAVTATGPDRVAFSQAERDRLDLTGRLPSAVLTRDQQALHA